MDAINDINSSQGIQGATNLKTNRPQGPPSEEEESMI